MHRISQMKKAILLLVPLYIFCSCNNSLREQLNIAEKIMNDKPDSAMAMLNRIDIDSIHNRQDKAKYALLHTISLAKNYIFSKNDSIIQIARNYYKRDPKSLYYCLSEFYYGEILQNRGEDTKAMIKFLSIIDAAEELKDHYFLGLLYSDICELYTTQCDFDNTLKYARLEYDNYIKADKPRHAYFALMDIGDAYYDMQKYDSTLFYYNKSLDISTKLHDTIAMRILHRGLANTYTAMDKPQEACNALWFIKNRLKEDWEYRELTYMCRAQRQLGNYDSAKYYLKEAEAVTPNRIKAKAFVMTAAARLHIKTGEVEKAAEEYKYTAHIQDSLVRIALQHSYANQHRDYISKEKAIEEEKVKALKTSVILSVALLTSVIIIIVIILRSKLIKQRRREQEFMQAVEEINRVNRQGIDNLNNEYETKLVKLKDMLKSKFKIIEELAYTYYERSGTHEQRAIYKKVMQLLEDYSNDPATKHEIEEVVNACNDNIIEKIKQDIPNLKTGDIDLLIYILAGFPTRVISVLIDDTPQNIAVRKHRIKQKIVASETTNKDYYTTML